jgi:hypothetical protein
MATEAANERIVISMIDSGKNESENTPVVMAKKAAV